MRELTDYEKSKWFDEYGRFEMDSADGSPHFIGYGDELGEAFDGALYCTDKEGYGLCADCGAVLALVLTKTIMDSIQANKKGHSWGGPPAIGEDGGML